MSKTERKEPSELNRSVHQDSEPPEVVYSKLFQDGIARYRIKEHLVKAHEKKKLIDIFFFELSKEPLPKGHLEFLDELIYRSNKNKKHTMKKNIHWRKIDLCHHKESPKDSSHKTIIDKDEFLENAIENFSDDSVKFQAEPQESQDSLIEANDSKVKKQICLAKIFAPDLVFIDSKNTSSKKSRLKKFGKTLGFSVIVSTIIYSSCISLLSNILFHHRISSRSVYCCANALYYSKTVYSISKERAYLPCSPLFYHNNVVVRFNSSYII